jgi:hypothetical protein
MKNLTNSNIDRQNILNNKYALKRIQEYIGITGMIFEGEYRFTKEMVADFFEIEIRTIERYLDKYSEELKHNGYILTKGKRLKELKLQFAHVINVGSKTTQLGLFNFRALLNLGMLLSESEKAKHLRSKILDIVLDTINQKTGGNTKYINKRDTDYLSSAIKEPGIKLLLLCYSLFPMVSINDNFGKAFNKKKTDVKIFDELRYFEPKPDYNHKFQIY